MASSQAASCLNPAGLARQARSGAQHPRRRHEFIDAQRLGTALRVNAESFQCRERAGQAFQALAQHLAALAEGGMGNALEFREIAGQALFQRFELEP